MIKGWDLGVATMKKGEIADFKIRSDYGYGESGSMPKIPPNATLNFEVTATSIVVFKAKGEGMHMSWLF